MSGFGNPFKEIPRTIGRGIKRLITRKTECSFCHRIVKVKNTHRDYLDRFKCNDEKECEDATHKYHKIGKYKE